MLNSITADVDSGVTALVNIYHTAADCMRSRNMVKRDGNSVNQAIWWDAECGTMKCRKYELLRNFRVTNLRTDLLAYTQHRKTI